MSPEQIERVAVTEIKVGHLQSAYDHLIPIVEGLVITTGNLVTSCKYTNDRQNTIEPKVDKLWDNQNKASGGITTVKVIIIIFAWCVTQIIAFKVIHP